MIKIEKIGKESNRDYAFRVIKANIINLEIKPGTMISEQDIADELQLSRTPVHEALQELARTKIIDIQPQKGSLVSLINMKLVDEAVFMRSIIESAVTEEACKIASAEDIKKMEENVELQFFYQKSDAFEKILELDNAFHKMVYEITDKMQCYYVIRLMNIHYDRFREVRMRTSKSQPIIDEHRQILEAFKNKDSTKAKDLILQHLNRLYVDEKMIRAKFPDYFEKN